MLQEDEPQRNVLVIRRIHVATQLVRGLEEAGFNTEVAPIAVRAGGFLAFGDGRRLDGFGWFGGRFVLAKRNGPSATAAGPDHALVDQLQLDPFIGGFVPAERVTKFAVPGRTAELGQCANKPLSRCRPGHHASSVLFLRRRAAASVLQDRARSFHDRLRRSI